uniref:Tight junction-associated protein 1 domain-containing protein n=1 Tax=Falco tinnunculus TaxID=100819 RepID=A0A8C4UPE7_FALTI
MSSTAPSKKPYRKAPPQHREIRHEVPIIRDDQDGVILAEQSQEPLTDAERMKLLQHENEELRRRLTYVTNKMEAMERELESGQDYLEMELGQNREELEKFKDKFRRLQNSYTASQRTNQDLEEKLHALIKKAEMDRKTLDWEIVELTNKLLDAKTTINKLEELNERYRQDCNLAVQLLKCNKSHFRNHKFADLPYELQDMVNKHLHSTQESAGPGQEATHTLAPSDVVPTSVIARVLEKPESLVLNSAKSSSGSCPMAEDVFVHVDMSGAPPDACNSAGQMGKEGGDAGKQQNGGCKPQSSVESVPEEVPAFEKLSPYPTPSPPHPMYPGRKVIEFSEDKVRIPKNSPLPNCTYATRQAISLSLVQSEDESCDRHRTLPNSPASEGRRSASSCSCQQSPKAARAHGSSQSSPFSSPPQIPSAFASSASSEEDLLANWQRMFVDKAPPTSERVLMNRTAFSRDTAPELQKRFSRSMQELGRAASAYSDGEESAQSCSWTTMVLISPRMKPRSCCRKVVEALLSLEAPHQGSTRTMWTLACLRAQLRREKCCSREARRATKEVPKRKVEKAGSSLPSVGHTVVPKGWGSITCIARTV